MNMAHPGELLRDELVARGWSQTYFARLIRRPVRLVCEIVNAKKSITAATALQIGEALGTSPELWATLQMKYDLYKAEVERLKGAK